MGPYLVQLDLGPKLVQLVLGWPISTGCIKKMVHSDFSLKSVPGVKFYFFKVPSHGFYMYVFKTFQILNEYN